VKRNRWYFAGDGGFQRQIARRRQSSNVYVRQYRSEVDINPDINVPFSVTGSQFFDLCTLAVLFATLQNSLANPNTAHSSNPPLRCMLLCHSRNASRNTPFTPPDVTAARFENILEIPTMLRNGAMFYTLLRSRSQLRRSLWLLAPKRFDRNELRKEVKKWDAMPTG